MARTPYRILDAQPRGLTLAWRTQSTAQQALLALGLSRSGCAQVFQNRQLTRESCPLTPVTTLTPGDVLQLKFASHTPPASQAFVSAAQLLWVDPLGLALAAEKPAHLLVHGDGSGEMTLTDQVARAMEARGLSGVPQALQRLDRGTSGVVLFSLHREFQPAFDRLVASHDSSQLSKCYFALVEGRLAEACEVRLPIGRDRHNAQRMHGGSGKEAQSFFEPLGTVTLEDGREVTAASVVITSGRRHQIRVHGASLGHPVVGDTLYGAAAYEGGLMLHSWQERFVHPVSGRRVQVAAPLPSRFPQEARRLAEGFSRQG